MGVTGVRQIIISLGKSTIIFTIFVAAVKLKSDEDLSERENLPLYMYHLEQRYLAEMLHYIL